MNNDFQNIIDQLHDARIFGFMYDNNREKFKSDFYIYVQLFEDFEDEKYEIRKSLLCFRDAKIVNLSIKDDLTQGQFFISGLNVNKGETYQFDFIFNSNDIKLSLYAANFEIVVSDHVMLSTDQYLKTDWENLLK